MENKEKEQKVSYDGKENESIDEQTQYAIIDLLVSILKNSQNQTEGE